VACLIGLAPARGMLADWTSGMLRMSKSKENVRKIVEFEEDGRCFEER